MSSLTFACSSEIRFDGFFASNRLSRSTASLPSGLSVLSCSRPIVKGTSKSATGITCMRRYSLGASNGVLPNKRQYSVTPRAQTSMALVMGNRSLR
jgi:hypothetical protein